MPEDLTEYKKLLSNGTKTMRIGQTVPEGDVNTSYIHTPEVSPDQNLSLVRYTSKTDNMIPLEQQKNLAVPDQNGRLNYVNLSEDNAPITLKAPYEAFPDKDPIVTRHFKNDHFSLSSALYYLFEIKYHLDSKSGDPNRIVKYTGNQIQITDENGNALDDNYAYEIYVKAMADNPYIYWVKIYLGFNTDKEHTYKIRYNHIDHVVDPAHMQNADHKTIELYTNSNNQIVISSVTKQLVESGKLRIVNGLSASKKVDQLSDYNADDEVYQAVLNEKHDGYHVNVTQKAEADPREHTQFNYKIVAHFWNGDRSKEQKVTTGFIEDWVMDPSALLAYEKNEYQGSYKLLSIPINDQPLTVNQLIHKSLPFTTEDVANDAVYEIYDAQDRLLYSTLNSPDNKNVETSIPDALGKVAAAKTAEKKAAWINAMHSNIRLITQPFKHGCTLWGEKTKTHWAFEWKATGQGEKHMLQVFSTSFSVKADVTVHRSSGDTKTTVESDKFIITLTDHIQRRIHDDEVDTIMKSYIDKAAGGSSWSVNRYSVESDSNKLITYIDEIDEGHIWGKTTDPLAGEIQKIPWSTSDNGLDVEGVGSVVFHEDGDYTVYFGPLVLPTNLVPDDVYNFHWNKPIITSGDQVDIYLKEDGETLTLTMPTPTITQLSNHIEINQDSLLKREGIKPMTGNIFADGDLYDKLGIKNTDPLDISLRLERGNSTKEPSFQINYRFEVNKGEEVRYPVDQFQNQLGANRLRLSQFLSSFNRVDFAIDYNVLWPKTKTTEMKDLFARNAPGAVMIEENEGDATWQIVNGVLKDDDNTQKFIASYNTQFDHTSSHLTDFTFTPRGQDDDLVGVLFRVQDTKNFYMLVMECDTPQNTSGSYRVESTQPESVFEWDKYPRKSAPTYNEYNYYRGWKTYHHRIYQVKNGNKILIKEYSTTDNRGYLKEQTNNIRIIANGKQTDIYFQYGFPDHEDSDTQNWMHLYTINTEWDNGSFGICNYSMRVEFNRISTILYDQLTGRIDNLSGTGNPMSQVAISTRQFCDRYIRNQVDTKKYNVNGNYIPVKYAGVVKDSSKGKVFVSGTGNGPILVFSNSTFDRSRVNCKVVAWTMDENLEATPIYAVKYDHARKIDIDMPQVPSTEVQLRQWFMRIREGHFQTRINLPYYEEKEKTPAIYTAYPDLVAYKPSAIDQPVSVLCEYGVPDYDRQAFFAKPYQLIQKEKALILNEQAIQTCHHPIVLKSVAGISYLEVEAVRRNHAHLISIKDIDAQKGIIYLNDHLHSQDEVYVRYAYYENHLIYKGFQKSGKYFYLDMNPSQGHRLTVSTEGNRSLIPMDLEINDYTSINETESNELLVRPISIYLRPINIYTENYHVIHHETRNIIAHTDQEEVFESDSYDYDPALFQLGKIYAQANSELKKDMVILDTRTRGGGLDEMLSRDLIKQINKESLYHWDIGFFDGEAFQENGIFTLHLPSTILDHYTEAEVQRLVGKYKALGTLPIIEYFNPNELKIDRFNLLQHYDFSKDDKLSYHQKKLDSGSFSLYNTRGTRAMRFIDHAQYGLSLPGYLFADKPSITLSITGCIQEDSTPRHAAEMTVYYTDGTSQSFTGPIIKDAAFTTYTAQFMIQKEQKTIRKILLYLNDRDSKVEGYGYILKVLLKGETPIDSESTEIHTI